MILPPERIRLETENLIMKWETEVEAARQECEGIADEARETAATASEWARETWRQLDICFLRLSVASHILTNDLERLKFCIECGKKILANLADGETNDRRLLEVAEMEYYSLAAFCKPSMADENEIRRKERNPKK